jgi:sigma-B regulation protein RsbU (phosphoserine phosphatase)
LARAYTRDGTFVTAFYAILDPAARTLTYSRAGHNPPRLVRGDRVLSLDKNGALPLGIEEGQFYQQSTITLERGDLLLLYTDGITEARVPSKNAAKGEMLGVERLDKMLLECATCSAADWVARIRSKVGAFCENTPQLDDQTLIAIRCL